MKPNAKNQSGQALIEYLLIFGFMALMAISMVKALGRSIGIGFQGMAYALSKELSTGVCSSKCFNPIYENNKLQ